MDSTLVFNFGIGIVIILFVFFCTLYERGIKRRFSSVFLYIHMYYLTSIKVVTIIVTEIQIAIHISTNRRKKNETCNRLCTPEYRKLQPCDFRNGKSELEGKGHEVRVRDLYELNF